MLLRDSYGVGQIKSVTGNKILRILKSQGMRLLCSVGWTSTYLCAGLAPEIPEDLYQLIKKAVSMRKHLDANKKDKDAKFHLILVESRIHRLARYYKVGRLHVACRVTMVHCCAVVVSINPLVDCVPPRRRLASCHPTGSMSRQRHRRWCRKHGRWCVFHQCSVCNILLK